jgi:hypothetical protein
MCDRRVHSRGLFFGNSDVYTELLVEDRERTKAQPALLP